MTIGTRVALTICVAVLGLPSLTWAVPGSPDTQELPPSLRKLPRSAAVLVHVDVAKIWDHPTARPICTILFEKWTEVAAETRGNLGIDVADIKTCTAVLAMGSGARRESTAVFFTTRKPLDRKAIVRAWGADLKYLEASTIPDAVPLTRAPSRTLRFQGPNTFSVISDRLEAEYAAAKPFPEGREPWFIREAASDRHPALVWFNLKPIDDTILPPARSNKEYQVLLPVLACREALLTGHFSDGVRLQGRLILGGADPETTLIGTKALAEYVMDNLVIVQARMKARNPDREAVLIQLTDLLIESLKTVEMKQQGDAITATGRLAISKEFVTKLEKALQAQVKERP